MPLFHIVPRLEWASRRDGAYAPPSLERQGFVHLSTADQWPKTVARFFSGRDDLLLVAVREESLRAPVRYESADGARFPHLYGALDLDAVEGVSALIAGEGRIDVGSGVDGLVRQLAHAYGRYPVVEAVALAGSLTGAGSTDATSDVDLYVYCLGTLELDARAVVASTFGCSAAGAFEIGNAFWESGDEWVADDPRVKVDVMFRDVGWMRDEIGRVLDRHEARLGYSTCFLHNLKSSHALYDRSGWFTALKARADEPYPPGLRDAILAKNYPVLGKAHSSYLEQIRAAEARGDRVSVNHRVAGLLASVFDIVFAVNLSTHPGEKRLLRLVAERCASVPDGFADAVADVLDASGDLRIGVGARAAQLVGRVDAWLDGLGRKPPWP